MSQEELSTDGRDHIFLCKHHEWVKIFSAVDGRCMITVLQGEVGISFPYRICWSAATDSLIIAHQKEQQYLLTSVPRSDFDASPLVDLEHPCKTQ